MLWGDADIDLSIIKIEKGDLSPINLGDSDRIKIGENVFAVGNPIGLEFQGTVTSGVISAVNRTIKIKEEENLSYMEDLIQTDATINHGNSGGPLINKNGEVIGINAVKIEEAEGIGFAIPINIIKPIIRRLEETGNYKEASIGIYAYDKEVIQYLKNLKFDNGIYVVSVNKNGAAYGKGLLEGDIISKIDNVSINKMNDLRKYIYTKDVGDEVTITVIRGKKEFELNIDLKAKK